MREILYSNLTAGDHKRRDLFIREVVTNENFIATIERKCSYFVRNRIYLDNPSDMDKLQALKDDQDAWKRKHFHILRNHDSYTGVDKLICKAAGTFYAIVGHYVFCVAFIQSFKIDLTMSCIDEQED